LCLADSILLFGLARRFVLPAGAAVFTAALWAFNFHGINMALLWLSGRTALLVVMFALMTAHAVLRGWRISAGLLCLAAMLCKEEAVVLPALFTVFLMLDGMRNRRQAALRHALVEIWPLWAALPIYAVLRIQSGAFSPMDAPSYYQFSLSPPLVVRNLEEYADRTATLAVTVVLVLLAVCRWKRPALSDDERRLGLFAAIWIPATFALTMFLPLRSSLYALLPSIGTSLAAGTFASWAARTNPAQFSRVAVVLILIAGFMIPVYRSRNQRWARLGDLSARVVRALEATGPAAHGAERLVLIDDPRERFNLESVFGPALPDALVLTLGNAWTGEIVSASDPMPSNMTRGFRLIEGDLVPAGSK
jgi:hypothetical protein